MAYDGSDFVGVESGTYSDNYPVDTWLDQRIRGNDLFLNTGRNYVSASILSGAVAPSAGPPYYNVRPWCSVDWTAPVCIPYWLDSTVEGADISVWAYGTVSIPGKLTITGDSLSRQIASADASGISGDIESSGNAEISVRGTFNRAQWGGLQLWIRSVISDVSAQTLTMDTLTGLPNGIVSTSTAISYPANIPTTTSFDVSCLQTEYGEYVDILAIDTTAGDMLITKTARTDVLQGANVGATCERFPMTYLLARSLGVRQRFRDTDLSVTANALRARAPVLGEIATKQAQRVQTIYDRKRLIAWGPTGYYPPQRTEEWPAVMPMKFVGVSANAAAGVASGLIQHGIVWRRNGGTMFVAMHLVGAMHLGSNTEPGTSGWAFTVSLEMPEGTDTDWATPTVVATKTHTQTIATWAAGWGMTPLLSQRHWLYGQTYTGSTAGVWPYMHRDGQLYGADMRLITTVVVELDMTGVAPGATGMLRVDADYQTGTLDGFTAPDTTPSGLGTQLECVCTGYSIWEAA